MGWGDVVENRDVLDTMLKLAPEDILHLLAYRHRYATKASVVQFIRLRHPQYVTHHLHPRPDRINTNPSTASRTASRRSATRSPT